MKLLTEKYANRKVSRQNAANLWRSTGSELNASRRVCQTPNPNENANSAKKQPVSSNHRAREARRRGDANPLPAAFAARINGAASRIVTLGAVDRLAFAGCGPGLADAAGATVALRLDACTGAVDVAASTASKAVRAAIRAPLPSTRPSRSRSMQPVYVGPVVIRVALTDDEPAAV